MAHTGGAGNRVLVIGAGVGGLTAAALLARAGLQVTVLEAHVYAGGCAGTFYHKGYRFDAGATLAGGFYPGGPMDLVGQAAGIAAWPIGVASETAAPGTQDAATMTVHLPGGLRVARYGDERRREEHTRAFGAKSATFWRWQESTADALWELALRTPPWPPQTAGEAARLGVVGLDWLRSDPLRRLHPAFLADTLRPLAAHLAAAPRSLRTFVDAQLLIAAQATSSRANALYGASALDLPRRGVVHLRGGMGAIAGALAEAVCAAGGRVLYRQEVTKIVAEQEHIVRVETKRGECFEAETVVANLPPQNVAPLLGEAAASKLGKRDVRPQDGWGAFMIYVGVDSAVAPDKEALHHQVVAAEPLGEGNSIFVSISPAWDQARAPAGKRALTISTHTALAPWWSLYRSDRRRYAARRQYYVDRMLSAAETALPGLREAASLLLPGTPVTFRRFTRREGGWVGGFPQTNLLRPWGPRIARRLWMVGDSIFPGQSTAAVALGGMRVAHGILSEYRK